MNKDPKNGAIVVITGAAATGKSTVAAALQAKLSAQGSLWLYSGIDSFAQSLRRDWASFEGRGGPFAERGFVYSRGKDGALSLTLGADGRRVMNAFHKSIAAIARSGINVVCEAVIYDAEDWGDWVETLEPFSTCWVKLSAPLAVLEDREKDRPQEVRGLARGMMSTQGVGRFDVECDTSIDTLEEVVGKILESMD